MNSVKDSLGFALPPTYSLGLWSSDDHILGASVCVQVGMLDSPPCAQGPTCSSWKELSRGCGEGAAEEIELWGHRACVRLVSAWDEQRAGKPRADLGTEEAILETTGRVVQAV